MKHSAPFICFLCPLVGFKLKPDWEFFGSEVSRQVCNAEVLTWLLPAKEVGLCKCVSFPLRVFLLFQSWDWHQFVQQRGGGRLSHGTNINRLAQPQMNRGSFPWNSVHASWQLPQSCSLFFLFVPSLHVLALVCARLFVSSAFSQKKGKCGDEMTEVVKQRVSHVLLHVTQGALFKRTRFLRLVLWWSPSMRVIFRCPYVRRWWSETSGTWMHMCLSFCFYYTFMLGEYESFISVIPFRFESSSIPEKGTDFIRDGRVSERRRSRPVLLRLN